MIGTPLAADSLRAALDSVFRSPAYDWRPPDMTVTWFTEHFRALLAWLDSLRTLNPVAYHVFLVMLIAVLLAIILHAAWILFRTARQAELGADTETVAALAARGQAWYDAEADRLAREGRFAEAVQAAFVALARRLDALGLLQYNASLTPAECARAARLDEADRSRLRRLVLELYRVAFGSGQCNAADYRRWRAEADRGWHAPAH